MTRSARTCSTSENARTGHRPPKMAACGALRSRDSNSADLQHVGNVLAIGFRENVFQRLRAVEIQGELLRACSFRSPRRARIRELGRPIELLGQETPDALSSCALLIFAVEHCDRPIGLAMMPQAAAEPQKATS